MQGHVDGTAVLVSKDSQPDWTDLSFRIDPGYSRYVVRKGSVALNGVSLTVAELEGDVLTVSLIPTTLAETNLGCARARRRGECRGRCGRQVRRADAGGTRVSPESLALVERALADLRVGKPVLVADSHDREDEADFIMSAQTTHRGVGCVGHPPFERLPVRAHAEREGGQPQAAAHGAQ